MESARFLIVVVGLTADAAVKGIREHDGSIVLVGSEQQPPYARPPLTKGLWSGADETTIWRGTEAAGAQLRLGRRIVSLDLDARRGDRRIIPETEGVVYYRTLGDYRTVRARVRDGARAVVIGG